MKEDTAGVIPAAAWIALKSYSKDKDGNILLTPECLAHSELNAWAEKLKDEIDSLVNQARAQFAKQQRRRDKYFRKSSPSQN